MVQGLSQSNLSKYEKGLSTLSEETVEKVMKALDFPVEFMKLRIDNKVANKHYRKKASITVANRSFIDRHISLIAFCFDFIADNIELPDFKFPYIDIEVGITPEEIARHIRKKFKLGTEPIDDIVNFLERNGITVYFWDCPYKEFDGVSLITDNGNHLIIVNKNRSNDRIRHTLAHEFGHSLMHQCVDFFIAESRDVEEEATKFAAEFLMPKEGIYVSLFELKFNALPKLKTYWGASMSSIIVRARKLDQIDDKKYTYLMTEISRNGWRLEEPYEVWVDEPTIIKKSVDLLKAELDYNALSISDSIKIPIDIVNDVFQLQSSKTKILSLKIG